MNRTSLFSTLGVLVAAVASVATSAPEPDWELDDSAEGDITITPDQEEAVVKLRVASEVVGSGLGFEVHLDPTPVHKAELADTPIVLFVSNPTEPGGPASTRLYPIPSQSLDVPDRGFENGSGVSIEAKDGAREFTVRIAWTSPNIEDRQASKCTGSANANGTACYAVDVERPMAERQTTKIHWRASIHAEGYDDRPRGAKVDIEAAPQ